MAISNIGGPAISADLMYQFYDNKAITPKIRATVQQKQDAAGSDSKESASTSNSNSASKFGPATRVSITDQIIRMNIANGTTKMEKESDKTDEASKTEGTTAAKKPSRYDVLTEVKKSIAEREAAAKAEKDAVLKGIADKIAASEKPADDE